MATLVNRGLSLVVVLTYLVVGYKYGGGEAALKVFIGILLPLACIWFPEPLGQYRGNIRGQVMTSSTPAFLVCAGGWLVLVGAPLIVFLVNLGS